SAPRCSALLSSLTLRPPPPATLFPYTTLFRSRRAVHPARRVAHVVRQVDLGRLPPVTPRQLQLAQPRGDQRVDRGAERAAVRAARLVVAEIRAPHLRREPIPEQVQ